MNLFLSNTNINNCSTIFPDCLKKCNEWKCLTDGPEFSIINGLLTKSTLVYLMKCKTVTDLYSACIRLITLTDPKIQYNTVRAINYIFNTCMNILHQDSSSPLYSYNKEKVQEITKQLSSPSELADITITMTTCKRFNLFYRTVNSMLACITDLHLVKEWIVVDDNSNNEALEQAKLDFPFITWICKDETNKGHAKSMNILLETIKTPYFFHVEDDFEWFIPLDYLTRCKSVLDENSTYSQCLVNIHYTEDSQTAKTIWGGELQFNSLTHFVKHLHFKNELAQIKSMELGCSNNYYWPGFSFRPGLNRLSIFKSIGPFSTAPGHFEMEYSDLIEQKGYFTAFLPGTFCTHIGRRTYERNSDKKNAYDLNAETQFGEAVKDNGPSGTNVTSIVTPTPSSTLPTKNTIVTFSVINLKRRPDRLLEFFKHNNKECPSIQVYYGVDGSQLKPSYQIQKCFETGDFNFRKGIVGCALSHINLWKECVSDMFCDYTVILEDDAICCKNFNLRCLELIDTYKGQFDFIYLHYHPWPQYIDHKNNMQTLNTTAKYVSKSESLKINMGGTTGYILTRNGARKLLNWVNTYGVTNGIDWVIFKASSEKQGESKDLLDIMYSTPFLVFAECVQKDNRVDSDIQRDYSSCGFNNWTVSELEWCKSHWNLEITTDDQSIVDWGKSIGVSIKKPSKKNSIIFVSSIDTEKHKCNETIYCSIKPSNITLSQTDSFIWYTTDKCLITVPHSLADDTFLIHHTLFHNRLPSHSNFFESK